MAATQSTTAIRSYRIYLRDAENVLARSHEVELASDEEARGLATRMLGEQTTYPLRGGLGSGAARLHGAQRHMIR
jgi:hypothetical protein